MTKLRFYLHNIKNTLVGLSGVNGAYAGPRRGSNRFATGDDRHIQIPPCKVITLSWERCRWVKRLR